jgi:hypothetical protein
MKVLVWEKAFWTLADIRRAERRRTVPARKEGGKRCC